MRRLTEEQETLVARIRKVEGFEDFIRGASFAKLQQVASEGPVIVVNHSQFRCDALILLPREQEPCMCVPLDKDWWRDALELWRDLLLARYENKNCIRTLKYDEALRRVMKALWDRVVSKVVEKLRELGISDGSRIWWCLTSLLPAFPFHAAGPNRNANGDMRYLLDDYISSYTPTLTSLITARMNVRVGT